MILLILAACFFFSALFSGLETGFISVDQFMLSSEDYRDRLSIRATRFLLKRPERLLSTTLIGTNISTVTVGIVVNSFVRRSPYPFLALPASLLLTVLLLIFAEIIPKTFFRRFANTLTVRMAPFLVSVYVLFLPLSTVLNGAVSLLLLVTGQIKSSKRVADTKQDLRFIVRKGSAEAGIPTHDQRTIEEIFDFQGTMAREVMIHVDEWAACHEESPASEILECAVNAGIDLVPVFDRGRKVPLGYVDVSDLFNRPVATAAEAMRTPAFVPETKRIPQLLFDMNRNGTGLVYLVNEYGKVTGLLTAEHIAAEIIGFSPAGVADETIERLGTGHFRFFATADIDDFSHRAHVSIPPGPYDTMGGYVCDRLGRIPQRGEQFTLHHVEYRVLEGDSRRIVRLEATVSRR